MRRMPTTKQLELIEYLSKGVQINNLPEEVKIDFPYNDMEEIDNHLDDLIEEEILDFENHTCDGCSINYYHTEEYEDYISLCTDDEFEFPETINTKEAFANWLINNLPTNPYAYVEEYDLGSGTFDNLEYYDFEGREYEIINNVIYFIGVLQNIPDPLLSLDTYQIYTTKISQPQNGYVQIPKLNVSDNLKTSTIYSNGSLHLANGSVWIDNGSYFRGQLGWTVARNNAYVKNLNVESITPSDNSGGIELQTWLGFVCGDPEISIHKSSGRVTIAGNNIEVNADILSEGTGYLKIYDLPTSDPGVKGAIWDDNGVLKISHPAP